MEKLQHYAKKYPYAVLGAGDLIVEQAKSLGRKSAELAKGASSVYTDLVRRGERLASGIRKSQPAKRVADNAKQAQTQLKGAVTSVRKALGAEEEKKASTRKVS